MRWLLLSLLLASCGGGGGSPAVPDVVLDHPGQIVIFAPSGHRPEPVQTLEFDLDTGNFFRCVGNGHGGVMMNADLPAIATTLYVGTGWDFGVFGKFRAPLPIMQPVAVPQTWAGGAPEPFESILAQAQSSIADGQFHVVIQLKPGTVRVSFGDFDSGDVPHRNPVVDESQTAIAFFMVGDTPLCQYTVRISNPVATWSPQ